MTDKSLSVSDEASIFVDRKDDVQFYPVAFDDIETVIATNEKRKASEESLSKSGSRWDATMFPYWVLVNREGKPVSDINAFTSMTENYRFLTMALATAENFRKEDGVMITSRSIPVSLIEHIVITRGVRRTWEDKYPGIKKEDVAYFIGDRPVLHQ